MKDFLSDEEMNALSGPTQTPDFLSDEEMMKMEQPPKEGLGADLSKRFETARAGVEKAQQGEQSPLSAALQTTGQMAGAVGDVGFAGLKALTPDFIEKPLGELATKGVEWGMKTKGGEFAIQQYSEFKAKHPEAAANVEALGNVLSILPPVKAGQVLAAPVKKITGQIVAKAKDTTVPVLEKFATKQEQKFVAKRATAFTDLFNGGVKTKNVYEKSKAKGFDVASTLASDDKFIPEVIDGKIIPDKAIIALHDAQAPLAQIVRGVIESEGKTVHIDSLRSQAYKQIEDLKDQGAAYDRAKNAIDNDLDSYMRTVADENGNISLEKIDDIKKAKYTKINWNNPDLLSADRAISRSARQLIEDSIDDVSVNNMNRELSKLYDAQEMLETLGGRAVQGGKLTKLFARGIGAGLGSNFGIPGGVIGAITADQLVGVMQSNYFQNPVMKKIIGEIALERPEIFKRAQDIINERAKKQKSRLQLPAPTQLETTSEFPGYRGVIKLK